MRDVEHKLAEMESRRLDWGVRLERTRRALRDASDEQRDELRREVREIEAHIARVERLQTRLAGGSPERTAHPTNLHAPARVARDPAPWQARESYRQGERVRHCGRTFVVKGCLVVGGIEPGTPRAAHCWVAEL